jgi:hypothetical protein
MSIRSTFVLIALAAAALSAATKPAAALDGYAVRVPLDIDVYDQPGGVGKARPQHLAGGSRVSLIEETSDHWCHIDSWRDPVPGGKGWIWCGNGYDGQDYSLIKLSADEINAPEPGQDGN